MEDNVKQCPFCGEKILITAKKCKYCKTWLNEEQEKLVPCPFCGNRISEKVKKCSYCGEWLKNENIELSSGYGLNNSLVRGITIFCVIVFIISMLMCFENEGGMALTLVVVPIVWLCLYAYLLPTIVAVSRNHPQTFLIALVNIFFGETFIGWVITLIWATTHRYGRHTHW